MTKPWDNEPTPIIDKAADDAEDNQLAFINVWFDARSLERRLRHAERLLTRAYQALPKFDADIYAHLEAAQKEDGR